MPSVDAAAITLRTHSRAQELHGASDKWAAKLEQVQYTLGEGAGVDAFGTGMPVLVGDLGDGQARWPMFADSAQDAGAVAVFAFPLLIGAIRIGTLDLYRGGAGELSSAEVADASVLAELAANMLGELFSAAERTGSEAPRPLTSYQDVNIATGMVAARLHVSLEDAFARLRAWAYSENRALLDVAQDLVRRRIALDQLSE
ncbi:GAF and ANTAR domain-containing protein [Phytoactinopolyspora alkaliphila]|uniref:GAF and ANTAR domain-containing protein n=1 Tax=Phytoactinopolyspora alkaliphila TaxID=1783498 RepID=A0A6N9YGF1_9ACTN|nr:GAF and ANTAR domain-containing protein [Phytoactinopolyspora alkaliphila]NED94042.1 GAF and ANTAR domain-containing protein [Phytoactinopolyspora alkaliphila]